MSGRRAAGLTCVAALLALACSDDEAAMRRAEVIGVWFQCDDDACETLANDGFELTDDGAFTKVRLESGDVEGVTYCEEPFGTFARNGDDLVLMPTPGQDAHDEPRTVRFTVDGDQARLTDETGATLPYLRVTGDSSGNCPGVL